MLFVAPTKARGGEGATKFTMPQFDVRMFAFFLKHHTLLHLHSRIDDAVAVYMCTGNIRTLVDALGYIGIPANVVIDTAVSVEGMRWE